MRLLATWAVGQAYRGAATLEHLAGLWREPAVVAKLHGEADGAVEPRERLVQQQQIGRKARRQLEQDRAELATQPRGPLQETLHRLGGIVESLEVREVPAHLQREDEVARGVGPPLLEDRSLWQVVEGVVHLDRLKALREIREPQALRQLVGIEHPLPMSVLPSRSADK